MSPAGAGTRTLGILGGSGIYELEGLAGARWEKVESAFGSPSDELLLGELDGVRLAFLPRHGRGHPIPPSRVNYRANLDALKRVGATDVISLSACGSLREDLAPGCFVLVDQYIDRTVAREASFFERGMVAHVSLAKPVCAPLGDCIEQAAHALGLACVRGGTYVAIEGPQFSSLAESRLYRSWGCDVIGMTNMPEARLAREAELCYASIAMVTDYDCWHEAHANVEVAQIIALLASNAANARALLGRAARSAAARPQPCAAGCDRALEHALITAEGARDPELLRRLDAVAGRVLRAR